MRNRWFRAAILHQAPECAYSVLPLDFLALFIRTAPIADADFVNAQFPLGDLYRDFRLETEAFFLQRNRLDDVAAKSLVTRLHIAEVDIGKCVGKQSENPVAHRVSEVKHAMRTSGQKARPVDYVGAPFNQGLQQHRVLCRIVLEIGILDDDEIPRSFPNAAVQRRTLPMFLG